ncbi:MAG TPA: hypothetical protein VFC37_22950 [Terracidiphilus sp.]|nr:hypothetical protein [Terracidiphilus sp.]
MTTALLDLVKKAPDGLDKLKPVIRAQSVVAKLNLDIAKAKHTEATNRADEARDRDKLNTPIASLSFDWDVKAEK